MKIIRNICIGLLGGKCGYQRRRVAWDLDIFTVLIQQCWPNRLGDSCVSQTPCVLKFLELSINIPTEI
jgi:hypothetical protein